jgi:hypothetical protein
VNRPVETGIEPSLARIEARLARLEELLARLAPVLDAAEKLPVALAVATDSFDQRVASMTERGIDLGERLGTALGVLERVTSPEVLAVIEQGLQHHETASRILRSGAFDAPALEIISKLAASLASASASSAPVGLWGAMKAAGSSPVQHALGFAVALASRFGESLNEARQPAQLTRGEP